MHVVEHSRGPISKLSLLGPDKALKKKKALQEKSKRAQRRYRERKKVFFSAYALMDESIHKPSVQQLAQSMQSSPDCAPDLGLQAEAEELKKQIEELSSRLSTLTAEKNQLQNRNSLLEKVVQVRGGGGNASVSAQVWPPALSLARIVKQHVFFIF